MNNKKLPRYALNSKGQFLTVESLDG
jgi:hypothetical protein